MIALVGDPDQDEVKRISEVLNQTEYKIINTVEFPDERSMSIEIPPEDTGIDVYYVQSTNSSTITILPWEREEINKVNTRDIYKRYEKDGFLKGYLMIEKSKGKLILNNPLESELHHYKPYQIERLSSSGLPVPPTCITNNINQASKFFDKHEKVVVKPVGGAGHAGLQTKDDFKENEDSLEKSPVVFQKYIPGDDIRAYALDGEFLCAYRVESNDTVVDYRGSEKSYSHINDTQKIKTFSEQAASCFEYDFCAIDLKSSHNKTVVLDCSPRPGFAAIETALQTREISSAVASFLKRMDNNANSE